MNTPLWSVPIQTCPFESSSMLLTALLFVSILEWRLIWFHSDFMFFLGNYYYLQAEKDKKKLEEDYKKITSPTRMQYARYRNGLSDVFTNSYGKAKAYLQRVLQVFPSMEAGNTLEKIKKMELELK